MFTFMKIRTIGSILIQMFPIWWINTTYILWYSGGDSTARSEGGLGSDCSTDYIWVWKYQFKKSTETLSKRYINIHSSYDSFLYFKIPNAYASDQFTSAISQQDVASDPESETTYVGSRFCGRYFVTSTETGVEGTAYEGGSICCKLF